MNQAINNELAARVARAEKIARLREQELELTQAPTDDDLTDFDYYDVIEGDDDPDMDSGYEIDFIDDVIDDERDF